MKKKINKARLFRNIVLLLLVGGIVGIYLSNRFVKTKGFENLNEFISNYRLNKNLIAKADTKEMTILLSEKNYAFIKDKRQESLNRGVQVNKGDNYVKCKVVIGQDTVKGEMRLKGHMTDHLEGKKWSFRVKTKHEVLGMYRFSLQNPGTRNYVYEWIYHQLLAHEGIIHLKYDFIHLKLNENDLGIYAIEEHFGQHVLRDNNRPPGAILRWNPELYWEHRMDEYEEIYLDEQYTDFSSTFAEAYDRGVVKKDEDLSESYLKGTKLLEDFRRGTRLTSEVFDVEKMASFHAIIDLVGGYHSLDWSDVKFYYNSSTGKIEPVGYESFSVRETHKIAGQRLPDDYTLTGYDYHDRLFADPVFFEAYIESLERICNEAYFESFVEKIQPELDKKRGILAEEYAYIRFSLQPYYKNIELIRHNLELPKAVHAFLETKTDSTVVLSLAPVSDYPVEIVKLVVDGKKEYAPDSTFVLPPKPRNTFTHYFDLTLKHSEKKLKDLEVIARIPGSKNEFVIPVSDLPSYMKSDVPDHSGVMEDTILTWLNDSTAVINQMNIVIAEPLKIEKDKKLLIRPGQQVVFQNEGQFIIAGELFFAGSRDVEIAVEAELNGKAGIILQGGTMAASNVQFAGVSSNFILGKECSITMKMCTIADTDANFINAQYSSISMNNCNGGNMQNLGTFDRCTVKLKENTFKNGDLFLAIHGSDVELYDCEVINYQTIADVDHLSTFSSWDSFFEVGDGLGAVNNASRFELIASSIQSVNGGKAQFFIDNRTDLPGESSYMFYSTNSEMVAIVKQGDEG